MKHNPTFQAPSQQTQQENDEYWMQQALQLATEAEKQGEVPVGALLIQDNKIIASGFNCPISSSDPTAHAEVIALRHAATKLDNYRLLNTRLYVTLEPCAMCLGAMLQARVTELVFGAYDPRAGAVDSVFQILEAKELNHRINWRGGILADECAAILKQFFQRRR